MDRSNGRGTSSEALERIQRETQRVKNKRRTIDSDRKKPEQHRQRQHQPNYHNPSVEVSAPNHVHTPPRHAEHPLNIEPSTGSYFEDPVPARNMSNHLKSEHEAFKARCVTGSLSNKRTRIRSHSDTVFLFQAYRRSARKGQRRNCADRKSSHDYLAVS